MSPPRYRSTILAASRRPAIWGLLAGGVTVFLGLLVWTAGLVWIRALATGGNFIDTAGQTIDPAAPGPAATIFVLLVVAGLGFGTFLAAGLWQRRSPRSLIGPGPRTLRDGVIAATVTGGVLVAITLATLPFIDAPEPAIPPATWLLWLPIAVLALILQTGGEEVLFRGYLQSQLAARFRRDWIAVLVPSLLFGLSHYAATLPAIPAAAYVLIAAFFGLLAADLTFRTGSLGAAWGFHFANNALAILIIAPEGPLSGLALWQTSSDTAEALASPFVSVEIAILLITWFLIRRALRV